MKLIVTMFKQVVMMCTGRDQLHIQRPQARELHSSSKYLPQYLPQLMRTVSFHCTLVFMPVSLSG